METDPRQYAVVVRAEAEALVRERAYSESRRRFTADVEKMADELMASQQEDPDALH
jgi:hypothetical protein